MCVLEETFHLTKLHPLYEHFLQVFLSCLRSNVIHLSIGMGVCVCVKGGSSFILPSTSCLGVFSLLPQEVLLVSCCGYMYMCVLGEG